MERAKAEPLVRFLLRALPHSVAVGSYRRGSALLGDLDLLVKGRLPALPPYAARIREGSYYYSTVAPFDGSTGSRRNWIQVDVWSCEPADAAYALLHYTGSKNHNIGMRVLAKRKGWKLNQYGLFDARGTRFPARSEREIFQLLGKAYKPPSERD